MDTITLETERLLLRPFRETDLQELFECCQNPNLGNNAGWEPHKSIEDSKEILHTVFMGNEGVFAMILKENNSLVGSIGIIPDPKRENPRTRMLGYWLKECHWGKGIASEATHAVLDYGFNVLGLHLISANCYPHNTRSRHLLERHGFVYEGILHEAETTYDGHIYDHLCFYLKRKCYDDARK
ncbi:GNAT family N-acetyltransferase [Bacteroides fragilis]|uniref:GNAT family N-acetyltransferase n=1 Tax=Bacteroides fragilis TaxID=817 RepID=UPI001C386229|nr:GNAT family N-acetyltransferase [Bacteroides fragilis]